MKLKGRLKRIVLWVVGILTVLILSIEFSTQVLFKGAIKKEIQLVLDDRLESEATFKKLSISIFKNFPDLTITFKKIRIEEGPHEILNAGKLVIEVSPFDFFHKNYVIKNVKISKTSFSVEIDSLGKKYEIRGKPTPPKPARPLSLDIPKITIKDSYIKVHNRFKKNRQVIAINHASLALESHTELMVISGDVEGRLDTLIAKGTLIPTGFPLIARNATFRIDQLDKKKIFNGELILDHASLHLDGKLNPVGNGNLLDVSLQSQEGNLDDFLPLLPTLSALHLKQVNPEATMLLKIHSHGYVNPVSYPALDLEFEIMNATLARDGMDDALENVNLIATYSNGEKRSPETTKLVVQKGTATLKDNFVDFSGEIENFNDPFVDMTIRSKIVLEDIKPLLKLHDKRLLRGLIEIDAVIQGRLSDLEKDSQKNKKRRYDGEIKLTDVWVDFPKANHIFESINGSLKLEKKLLLINNINGKYNQSDFSINGRIKNLAPIFAPVSQEILSANIDFYIDRFVMPDSLKSNENKMVFPHNITLNISVKSNEIMYQDYKIQNLNLAASLQKENFNVSKLNLRFDETQIEARISRQLISGIDEVVLEANLGKLSLDKYLPKKDKKKESDNADPFPSDLVLRTGIKVDQLVYNNEVFENIELITKIDEETKNIKKLIFDFPYGRLSTLAKIEGKQEIEKISGEALLELTPIEINELKAFFLKVFPTDTSSTDNSFLSDNIDLDFALDITSPSIEYDSIYLSKVKSRFLIGNGFISVPNIDFELFDGPFHVSGFVDDRSDDELGALINIDSKNIDIGKITVHFSPEQRKMFNEETFKGTLDIDGELLIAYNKENLEYQDDDLLGMVKIVLNNGELINFAPISESLKFLRKNVRENIQLNNQDFVILFHNDEIVIPSTRFSSNLSNIEFMGYHSKDFDFGFDLRVSAGDLLFGSQKKKKERVKKQDTSFGAFNTFLSARTESGELKISKIKKHKYYEDMSVLQKRHDYVDSVLLKVKSSVIQNASRLD